MNDEQDQNLKTTSQTGITPELNAAIRDWQEALVRRKAERTTEHPHAYCKATDELAQAIRRWTHEQPELAEQFMFFFEANVQS